MSPVQKTYLLIVSCALLCKYLVTEAQTYDYTSSIECLESPHTPQYSGGIIENPELNDGLKGWFPYGKAKLEHKEQGGNKFIVVHSRNQTYDSVSTKIYLHKDRLYTVSAWIQLSEGKAPVTAIFKTNSGFKHAGGIFAESKCWSMLKGGLTVDESGPAELYFESKNTTVEIWVDSISLQPFTEEEWKSHQDQSNEKVRKRNVKIQVVDNEGNPLPNTTISIKQRRAAFPFGCAITNHILTNRAYQNWFTSRFKVTTFENEMKWYSTEPIRGREDYRVSDAMIGFCKKRGIAVRGHNVLWDDPSMQPAWVKPLIGKELLAAATKRLNSVMDKYKGQVIAWDVVNENLHLNFFETKIGLNASVMFYDMASKADPATLLFMNEYNTIEESGDVTSSPARYLDKLRQIRSRAGYGHARLAIGLEGHFGVPNLPYIRSSIDTLASASLPIWITELDVKSSPQQAKFLEDILRELHGHPKVAGIVMWAGWRPNGCYRMCLTDNNFKNLPTGDVVDKLLKQWGSHVVESKTDTNGFFDVSLFHGDYTVEITVPTARNFSLARSLKVESQVTFDEGATLQVTMSP